MARINLRDSTIKLKDGLSGTAALTDSPPMEDDTNMDIDTVALNTDITDQVPIGARFTVEGETDTPVHTVTARTPDPGTTTNIEFTPALGAGSYMEDDVVTFQSQELEIKIGDGNLTYTENDEYEYELDRDNLDTVRRGADQPMEVSTTFVYEAATTGTGETVAPMDAIKRRGSASEWVSSATDKCEPYAIDVEVTHVPPCGTKEDEVTTFPDFRSESREFDYQEAQISVSGRCNAVEPIITRE